MIELMLAMEMGLVELEIELLLSVDVAKDVVMEIPGRLLVLLVRRFESVDDRLIVLVLELVETVLSVAEDKLVTLAPVEDDRLLVEEADEPAVTVEEVAILVDVDKLRLSLDRVVLIAVDVASKDVVLLESKEMTELEPDVDALLAVLLSVAELL